MGGYPLTPAFCVQLLGGGGLDVHVTRAQGQRFGYIATHRFHIGSKPGKLYKKRGIHVEYGEPGLLDQIADLTQKLEAGTIVVRGIPVREMLADVPQCRRAEKRIADGMR